MGNREFRQMLIVVRRLCGHALMGPSGVARQSIERTRSPMSPAPARNVSSAGSWSNVR